MGAMLGFRLFSILDWQLTEDDNYGNKITLER